MVIARGQTTIWVCRDGADGVTFYTWIAYSDNPDGNPLYDKPRASTKYIGIAYNKEEQTPSKNPSDYTWSNFKGEQGPPGEGMSPLGEWYDGLHVPRLGVVTMDGKAFTAHRATDNPPMWTVTDHDGRHIVTKQGYILTGEMNTDDYYLIVPPGEPGKDGCVIRDSEWAPGVEYRNDSSINAPVRYIDVVLVRNDSTASGYDAYRCLRTHVSSPSLDYTFTDFWEKFGSNVGAIFTSLIVAKNAKIRFLQGNELRIEKPDGTVTAGIRGGSDNGDKVRIWAGSADPNKAPFRVDEDGSLYAEKGTFKGNISIASRKILLNEDGSGQLAGGNISWNTSGDVRLSGEFSISKNGFTLKLDPNFSEYRIYDSSNRPVVSLQPFMDQPGSSPTLRLTHPSSGFDASLTVSGLSLGDPAGSYAALSVSGLEFREGGAVFRGFTGQARINIYDNIQRPVYKMLKIKNGIIYALS